MSNVRIESAGFEQREHIAAVMSDCGDASHCWCAFWSRPRADFSAGWGQGNKRWFMKELQAAPRPRGVLAYVDGEPAGWCAIAPRAEIDRLARSRNLAPVDATPVWSITCFVIAKRFRRQGLMRALIEGAVAFARTQHASVVEAYPVDPQRKSGSSELYTGLLSTFLDAGFREIARRAPSRPIVRLDLRKARKLTPALH